MTTATNTLEAVDYQAPNADRLFTESLRTTGFGVLKNHPLSENQVQHIYSSWKRFFDSEEKNNFASNADTYDGFFPIELAESAKGQSLRDLKEYFHFYPWGQCPSALQADIAQYYADTVSFAAKLLSWIEEQTPASVSQQFSEPLSSMIHESDLSLLRILHYPPIPEDSETDAVRANAHEDINLLTILPAANEPGLQVLSKQGQWLDVPCDFGHLIINSGDMLQEATGGYYPSTTHRVINPEGQSRSKARISLPLFLHPRPDVVLSDRYTAQSYREERLAELRDTS